MHTQHYFVLLDGFFLSFPFAFPFSPSPSLFPIYFCSSLPSFAVTLAAAVWHQAILLHLGKHQKCHSTFVWPEGALMSDPRGLSSHLWLFQAGLGSRALLCDLCNNGGLSKEKKGDNAFDDSIEKTVQDMNHWRGGEKAVAKNLE